MCSTACIDGSNTLEIAASCASRRDGRRLTASSITFLSTCVEVEVEGEGGVGGMIGAQAGDLASDEGGTGRGEDGATLLSALEGVDLLPAVEGVDFTEATAGVVALEGEEGVASLASAVDGTGDFFGVEGAVADAFGVLTLGGVLFFAPLVGVLGGVASPFAETGESTLASAFDSDTLSIFESFSSTSLAGSSILACAALLAFLFLFFLLKIQ